MNTIQVPGADRGKIVLYALSTCGWCKKAKKLLDELGVAYEYIDVDLLEGAEKEEALKEVRRWNPNPSYPTIVIKGEICIRGFDENRLREELK